MSLNRNSDNSKTPINNEINDYADIGFREEQFLLRQITLGKNIVSFKQQDFLNILNVSLTFFYYNFYFYFTYTQLLTLFSILLTILLINYLFFLYFLFL